MTPSAADRQSADAKGALTEHNDGAYVEVIADGRQVVEDQRRLFVRALIGRAA